MKFLKGHNYFFLLLIIGFFSCKKNLDLQPTDFIDGKKAFATVDDLNLGVIGAYATWSGENTLYIGSILADDVRWGLDNSSRNFGGESKWQYSSGGTTGDGDNVGAAYLNLYRVINEVNGVLGAMDQIEQDPSKDALKSRLKGECLAIRGFALFEIFRWYAQDYSPGSLCAPIMLQSDVFAKPARSSVADVLKQVNQDLADAKGLIPSDYTGEGNSRITNLAISGMQARVALYAKDWQNAKTYATEVINAVPLATKVQFPTIWTDASNAEVLFKLKRATSNAVVTLWTDANGQVFFSPSFKLINAMDAVNDIRYNAYIKYGNPRAKEQWLVNKYPGQGANNWNDVKMLRVSEMYLIRAEANANLSDFASASADLNTLRSARINNFIPNNYNSQNDVITQVYNERFIELAMEGHRYFDLRRANLPVQRSDEDVDPTVTGVGDIPQELLPTNYHYILPIPLNEVRANSNIQQNPGYTNN